MKSKSELSASPSSARRLPRLPRGGKSITFRRAVALTAALGVAGLSLSLPVRADVYHWTGSALDTLWETDGNWDTGVSPGLSSNINYPLNDVFNDTGQTINYLLGAGTRTINTFSNNNASILNINLSDPLGQNFVVNFDVNNLLNSTIDITGTAGAVYFNFNGGGLTNDGSILVHDGGGLNSFADNINNLGTITGTNGAIVALGNSGISQVTNSGTIEADGTGVTGSPSVFLAGDTLTNSGTIQAHGGNGAALSVDFAMINNNNGGVITASETGSTVTINSSAGVLNNYYSVVGQYGGIVTDFSDTVNNNAYLDSTNSPDPYRGYRAFRGGQVYFFGNTFNNGDGTTPGWIHSEADTDAATYVRIDGTITNNVGSHITAENTGAGTGLAQVDLNINHFDLTNYGTIEALNGGQVRSFAASISNQAGALINSNGVNSNGLDNNNTIYAPSTIYLGDNFVPDNTIGSIDNTGSITATNGGALYATVTNVTNNLGGLISAQGFDAASGFASTVVLGNYADPLGPYNGISSLTNAGEISALNGGNLSIVASALDNSGNIIADGTFLYNGNANFAQSRLSINVPTSNIIDNATLTNEVGGLIAATNGGALTAYADSGFTNAGIIRADGVGETSITSGIGQSTTTFYTASKVDLHSFQFSGSGFSTSGTMEAINGGQLVLNYLTPLTNSGTISADGVGLRQRQDDGSGGITSVYQSSALTLVGSALLGTPIRDGSILNDTTGQINATNGGSLNIVNIGDFSNKGAILVDGIGLLYDFGSVQSYNHSNGNITDLALQLTNGGVTTAYGGGFTNMGSMTVTNGGQLSISAQNNITNSGGIYVDGSGIASGAPGMTISSVSSNLTLNSQQVSLTNAGITTTTGGDINLTGGYIVVADGANVTANADNNITQSSSAFISVLSGGSATLNASNQLSNAARIGQSKTGRSPPIRRPCSMTPVAFFLPITGVHSL